MFIFLATSPDVLSNIVTVFTMAVNIAAAILAGLKALSNCAPNTLAPAAIPANPCCPPSPTSKAASLAASKASSASITSPRRGILEIPSKTPPKTPMLSFASFKSLFSSSLSLFCLSNCWAFCLVKTICLLASVNVAWAVSKRPSANCCFLFASASAFSSKAPVLFDVSKIACCSSLAFCNASAILLALATLFNSSLPNPLARDFCVSAAFINNF